MSCHVMPLCIVRSGLDGGVNGDELESSYKQWGMTEEQGDYDSEFGVVRYMAYGVWNIGCCILYIVYCILYCSSSSASDICYSTGEGCITTYYLRGTRFRVVQYEW